MQEAWRRIYWNSNKREREEVIINGGDNVS